MRDGCRRLLVQGATGMGKTVLVAHLLALAAAKGKRAWFCVHRKELLDQAVQTFVEAADIHTGIVAAGHPIDASAPVQVCSIGSLKRRLSKLPAPDLIVFDECHHVPSASWSAIASAIPSARQLGLTATPQRLDGNGLGAHFDAMILGPTVADLIAQGYLSPYRLFAPAQFDASTLHTVAGDYNRAEVSVAMKPTVIGDAVTTYQRQADGGRALVFAWSLDASRSIAEAFHARGIPAAHVDGDTPAVERAAVMRAFREGSILAVCNVDLFGEGLDVPAVDAVFLLRPTASLGLYLQQCGRGLRPALGKSAVRLFDHVNNWTRHGLPDDPRTWTLDGDTSRGKKKPPALKRCVQCFAVATASARQCPYCQAAYPVKARELRHVAGDLVEADIDALRISALREEYDCRTLHDWQALAKRRGFKSGWAWHRWTTRKRRAPATTPETESS